jgi:hydroxyethylthiazole kinase-like uncharacterized protein yjeF
MHALYLVDEIRALERAAAAQLAPGTLMQRAGAAAAHAALALLPPPGTTSERALLQAEGVAHTQGLARAAGTADVLVLAGPGNNGGDALEVAANLADAGVPVTIVHLAATGAVAPETAHALARARASSAVFTAAIPAGVCWALVVDGLFGIGLARALDGPARGLVEQVNGLPCPLLALDVPSGLDADTGAVVGTDAAGKDGGAGKPAIAVRATHTITFIGDKPGLHTNEGRDHAGLVEVAQLGLDAATFAPARLHLNEVACFAHELRRRLQNSHKGSYGNVAVIGGAPGMSGAPLLAARTALHGGAGRVYALFVDDALPCDSGQPELMCRAADGYDLANATLVIGPGLGDSAAAHALLARAIASDSALLADADALNLLATDTALGQALSQRAGSALLTPHPLEAARLLGVPVAEVQADRVASARRLAARFNAVVVLKGSGTVIAAPNGEAVINTTGNAALATAGTGDVLSGLCGALLAQRWPLWEAALAGVWLHGTAADVLVADGVGPIGLTAGELVPAIRAALNRLVAQRTP